MGNMRIEINIKDAISNVVSENQYTILLLIISYKVYKIYVNIEDFSLFFPLNYNFIY